MKFAYVLAFNAVLLVGCAVESTTSADAEFATLGAALSPSGVVINEFRPGSAGWVELYNTTGQSKDISSFVLMNFGYNAMPKGYVVPPSTTIAGKGRLVVPLYIRSTVADGVHLLDHGGTYGPVDAENDVTGLYKLPAKSTKCFARQPDGGAWVSGAVACTKGAVNADATACTVGAACDDGDPCTVGETLSTGCACGGGKAMKCDDGNACTSDACVGGVCKTTINYTASACGNGSQCKLGVCLSDPKTTGKCTDQGGSIEGVVFSPAQACKAVAFMNGAKYSELEAMGEHPRQVIYGTAWSFVTQFANVSLIGEVALKNLLYLSSAWKPGGLWYDTVAAAYASKAAGTHFGFEKVWVSKLIGDKCYEIRDTPTAPNYLTACGASCFQDGCGFTPPPKAAGVYVAVTGRLEYSTGKWMFQNAIWHAPNPKL